MLIDPFIDIALIAFAVSLFTFVIQEKTGMKKKMDESKKKTNELNARLKELQKNPEANKKEIEQLTNEMLQNTAETMKASFGSMKYTMLPVLIVFMGIGWLYGDVTIVFPEPMVVPWLDGWGISLYKSTNWYGWYILVSLASSLILNSLVKRLIRK